MNTKQCSVCLTEKPLSEFQIRMASRDGRTAACKDCLRKRDRLRYPKERDARLAASKIYSKTDKGKESHTASVKRWVEQNKLKRAANVILGNYIRKGSIKPLPCFICGESAQAHHPDYSRPLDVIWLCPKHHKEAHAIGHNQ